MNTRVSVDAHPRYLIFTDAASFAIGAILLLLLSRIRTLLSPLAMVILIACLAVGFGFDILIWHLRGIRSIELDDESLTLYRGPLREMQRILRAQVSGLEFRSRLGRQGAVLRLGARRRLWIADQAFPKEEFERFLSLLTSWR